MASAEITWQNKSVRIFLHIIFWICVFGFYTFFYGRLSDNPYYSFIHLLYTSPLYFGSTYITMYLIIPNFLLTRKYKDFAIASFYMLLGVAYLEIMISICIIIFPVDSIPFLDSKAINPESLDIYLRLVGIYVVVFLASSIKLLKHWYVMQNRNRMLVQEKLEAELNILKSQVQPHFLFNTLNNLYALTLKKSDKSPDVVLKLSEILDFMLYHSSRDYVPLDREVKLIDNYIDLEKLRYSGRLSIEFNTEGNTGGKMIAPLILFPIVENCFKHGARSTNKDSWIKLNLNSSDDTLTFTAINSTVGGRENLKGGLGLNNLQRRLNLIYVNEYKFVTHNENDIFTATLTVPLKTGGEETEDEN